MNLARFIAELLRALWHECRFQYFALAHRHVGWNHPDSQHIHNEMFRSQTVVNDWIRRNA